MHYLFLILAQMPWDKPLMILTKNVMGAGAIVGFGAAAFCHFLSDDDFKATLWLFFALFCGSMWFWIVVA